MESLVNSSLVSLLVLLAFACQDRAGEPPLKDLVLSDVSGRQHALAGGRDRKAVVLLFLGTECPVSNGYAPEMSRPPGSSGPRSVAVRASHPHPAVTPEAAPKPAAAYRLSFPTALDPQQMLARRAGVTLVPQAVLMCP